MTILSHVVLVLAAFLLGSLPTGMWMARILGAADPRTAGSHSSGATNLGRLLGWRAGVLTGLVDMAKGLAGVSLAGLMEPHSPWLATWLGLAAVSGHIWTPLAGWRGGKGAATGLGAVLFLAPIAAALALSAAAMVLLAGRRMAPATLIGALLLPGLLFVTREADVARLAFSLALLFILIVTHRENLRRLAQGTEERLW